MTAVLARLYICAIVIIGAFLSAAVEYAPAPRLGRRERRLHAVPGHATGLIREERFDGSPLKV
jgi:hypothetical protein